MDLTWRYIRPYLDKSVVVFINENLVFLRNKEEQNEHSRTIHKLFWKEIVWVSVYALLT